MKKMLIGGILFVAATSAYPALEDDLWGNERTFQVYRADAAAGSRPRQVLKAASPRSVSTKARRARAGVEHHAKGGEVKANLSPLP
jgi:hypothetical protein